MAAPEENREVTSANSEDDSKPIKKDRAYWMKYFNYLNRPGGIYCSVPTCHNNAKAQKGLSFHSFPVHHQERCKKWLEIVKSDKLNNLPLEKLKQRALCGAHFKKDDYINPYSNYKRLTQIAVPSIFLDPNEKPREKESGQQENLQSDSLTINSLTPDASVEVTEEGSVQENGTTPNYHLENRNGMSQKFMPNKLQLTQCTSEKDELVKRALRQKIKSQQSKIYRQTTRIEKLEARLAAPVTRRTLISAAKEFLSGDILTFVQMQLRKGDKRRVWSEEERAFAITMYENSRYMYRFFLRKGFVLPCLARVRVWSTAREEKTEQPSRENQSESDVHMTDGETFQVLVNLSDGLPNADCTIEEVVEEAIV